MEGGHREYKREVLERFGRCSVLAGYDATMTGDELHVRPRLGDRHSQLVKAVARREDGKAAAEGDLAAGGQTGGDADHVLLGDAHREEAVGELLPKFNGRG